MMYRILPGLMISIPMMAIAFTGMFYVGYQKYQLAAETSDLPKLSAVDYARYAVDRFRQQGAAQAAQEMFDLKVAMPQGAPGWNVEPYQAVHGATIMNKTYNPSPASSDTEASIQNRFRVISPQEKDAASATYIRGAEIVSLLMQIEDAPDPGTLEGQVAENLSAVADTSDESQTFAVIDGVEIRQLPQVSRHYIKSEDTPVNYRRFTAGVGQQITIFAVTNASDPAVQEVLSGIDMTALKTFAKTIDPLAPKAPELTSEQKKQRLNDVDPETAQTALEQPGFGARLKDFFMPSTSALTSAEPEVEDTQQPRRMTCEIRNGAKHCFFEAVEDTE